MVGLSEQIQIFESARVKYAANPSHAPAGKQPSGDTVCVIYAIHRASMESRLDPYDVIRLTKEFGKAVDTDTVVFNASHSTEEVLAAFDQVISELKAKVETDDNLEREDCTRYGPVSAFA